MNVRYDETVHATDDGGQPVCGSAMMPACAPEPTEDAVDCWECVALTDG